MLLWRRRIRSPLRRELMQPLAGTADVRYAAIMEHSADHPRPPDGSPGQGSCSSIVPLFTGPWARSAHD